MRELLTGIVSSRDWERLRSLANEDRHVLSRLLALTYQPEGLLRWQAIEALGLASGRVADRDPEFVRGFIRRLFWSLNDESGNVGWSAPEAIGEIVASCPDVFPEFGPNLVSLLDTVEEEYFCPGILWGIARVASSSPGLVSDAVEPVWRLLSDSRPQVRGLAAVCAGRLGSPEVLAGVAPLVDDNEPLRLYDDGFLRETTVAALARAALGFIAP